MVTFRMIKTQDGHVISLEGRTKKSGREAKGFTQQGLCAVCNLRPCTQRSVLCGKESCLVEWQRAYDAFLSRGTS